MVRQVACKAACAAVLLLAAQSNAFAAASGHSALALAVLVGDISPKLGPVHKLVLRRVFDDKKPGYGKTGKIAVEATGITCRAGDVDIAAFSCALTFGKKSVSLTGRKANELFATMVEAGVPSDGAAGTIFEALHALKCTVDPAILAMKSGGGADCDYTAGPS